MSFIRQNHDRTSRVLVVMNLTPIPRHHYRVGLPEAGFWEEVLNSDAEIYGGSNLGNLGGVTAEDYQVHAQPFSGQFTLPPLSIIAFRPGH